MKNAIVFSLILAGICLLIGVLSKLGALPPMFLGNWPHVYHNLAQFFVLMAIAFGVYGLLNKK